jgi:thiamine pyrophosphokinase
MKHRKHQKHRKRLNHRPALIVCNGEPPSGALLRTLAAAAGTVVGADGGANVCARHGVVPDVIVGDLDSVSAATLRKCSRSLLLYVDNQNTTDLEKALDVLVQRGDREALIAGADGRRIDFTFGNIAVLWRYCDRISSTVVGDGWYAIPLRGRMQVHAPAGTVVSVLPEGTVSGITLRGFAYPLRDATMRIGEIGVSNVIRARPATVSVRSGSLLVIVQRPWTRRAVSRRR